MFFSACSDGSHEQSIDKSLKVEGGLTTQIDILGARYNATLSDGITFNRDGYPSFVSSVKGISEKETFGRWTDGSQVIIVFNQSLPKHFTLKLKSGAFSPWLNKPIKIIVGNAQLETKFNKEEAVEVEIPVVTDGNARSIIFEFPDAKSPKELGISTDTRQLGLALVSLSIE